MFGILLKVGKEDVAQCIQALGHVTAARSLWAGLKMIDRRREQVLLRVPKALTKGFSEKDVAQTTSLRSPGHFWPDLSCSIASGCLRRVFRRGCDVRARPMTASLLWMTSRQQAPRSRISGVPQRECMGLGFWISFSWSSKLS